MQVNISVGRIGCHPYLITLELACHYFSTLDNPVDIRSAVRAEGDIKCPWLTSTV